MPMKVNNEDIWKRVKAGEVKGFSIEGYFADKYEMSLIENNNNQIINQLKELLKWKHQANQAPEAVSADAYAVTVLIQRIAAMETFKIKA